MVFLIFVMLIRSDRHFTRAPWSERNEAMFRHVLWAVFAPDNVEIRTPAGMAIFEWLIFLPTGRCWSLFSVCVCSRYFMFNWMSGGLVEIYERTVIVNAINYEQIYSNIDDKPFSNESAYLNNNANNARFSPKVSRKFAQLAILFFNVFHHKAVCNLSLRKKVVAFIFHLYTIL